MPQTHFEVTTYPEGATLYVNGEARGQTNVQRLLLDFKANDFITIRVAKDGYQPAGCVLSADSPRRVAFFLQASPKDERVLKRLNGVLRVLDQISNRLDKELAKREQ